jgi:hypothetical protein
MAGWLIMVGSVFALGIVVDRLSQLHTLEYQDSLRRLLAEPPGSSLGLGVDGATTLVRTLAMVTAGCATAAAILGYQVLRRSRSARVGVTVLAVPIFFAGLVTGGFVTSVVAASAAILWLQPARSWFDGTTPPARRTPQAPEPVAPPAPPMPMPPPSASWPPPAPGVSQTVAARPPTVLLACILTWVCTGLVALGLVASAVALAVSPDLMLDQIHRDNPDLAAQGISDTMLMVVTYLMIVGLVVWCAFAAVLAVLAFRRIEWARIVLVVSAAITAVLCLIGAAVGGLLLLVPLIASVACIALLMRADTRPWFARRDTP